MTDLDALLHLAHASADLGRAILESCPPGRIEMKGDRDYVTQVDLSIERKIRSFLAEHTPHIGFVGEEEGRSNPPFEGLTWILDPLDGTSNFVHGIPLYGTSLGLVRDATPVLGVVDFPSLDERFSASEGRGAYCGPEKIFCRHGTSSLRDAVVSIGDYAVGDDADEKNRHRLALTNLLAARSERVRMFGSAAIDLTWVACGRTDAFVALSNKPWDMTAGVTIVREAGGIVVDANGSDYTTDSETTVAASPDLIECVLDLIQEATRTSDSQGPE